MKKKFCRIALLVCSAAVTHAQQRADTAWAPAAQPGSVSVLWQNALPKAALQPTAVPAGFATQRYGFFCRQELKLDKKTVVPIRFRLGSQAICDGLEGK